jgi:hypothetical protein
MPKPLLLFFSFTLLPNSLLPLYCFIRKVSYQKQKPEEERKRKANRKTKRERRQKKEYLEER